MWTDENSKKQNPNSNSNVFLSDILLEFIQLYTFKDAKGNCFGV